MKEARRLVPPPLLATGDVGAIPYFSRLPTLDLIGLADEKIAHAGLTHAYIRSRNADLLILQDLYLIDRPPVGARAFEIGADVVLDIDGEAFWLDAEAYGWGNRDPARAHSGAGSTFQVVTEEGFSDRYAHVTAWDFENDRYHVFIRREYAQFDRLAALLK